MNCAQARDLIPLDVYGDLDAKEAGALLSHLGSCSDCRHEREALRAVRTALDAAAVPEVKVDVASIHQEAAVRQLGSLRRWKRLTIAAGALAAGLLALLLVRPDIEIGGNEFAVRWGDRPRAARHEVVTSVVQAPKLPRDAELDERVRILSDLVRALREDMETGDRARTEQLEILVARLEIMRLQSQQRWDETRRDVSALYTAQFGRREQGEPR